MPVATGPPRIIGRYALYDQLAAGGMAAVHFGRLLGPVGFMRTVAIKRLHPQFAGSGEFVAMFLDEARLASRIRHPNVVQTLDVVASGGELFVVMDFVHGEPLSRLLRSATERGERVPLRVVSSIMCGALHGLHAAHEAKSDRGESLGIVHRDVSPQNILVATDGIARVLDFGIAKAMGQAHVTRDGQLKGKLAYMAPEQLHGGVSCRTDVFAAAIVLWEALTGEHLFGGADDREVIGNVLGKEIEPPSTCIRMDSRALEATPEQLARLDAVTLRGLAREPEDRFESAKAMALELERCVGIASPAEVGNWVERIAGDVLSQRAQRVAHIENDSSSRMPESSPSTPSRASDSRSIELTGLTAPKARPKEAKRRRLGAWLVVAGVVTTVLVAATARGLRDNGSGAFVATPEIAAPLASVALGAPTSAPREDAPVPIAPSSTLEPTQGAATRRPVLPLRSSGMRKASPPRKNCDPPYTLDAAGHQRFKEECFH